MKIFLLLMLAAAVLAQTPPPQLRVSMISLGVTDMARAITFYRDTLGLAIAGQPGEVTLFRAGEVMIALNRPLGHTAGDRIAGAVEVIFPVDGVTAAHHSLTERGCAFVATPREVTSGTWAATFTDPDGHKLTILGPQ